MGYNALGRALKGRSLVGLQASGLGEGQTVDADMVAMATRYVAAIKQAQPEGPYEVGGWSSGGAIAYEMARQLHSAGEVVSRLLLIDTPTPQRHSQAPVPEPILLQWFIDDLQIPGCKVESLDDAKLPALPLAARIGAALQQLNADAGMAAEELAPIYQVFLSLVGSIADYEPTPIDLPVPTTLVRAETTIVKIGRAHV